MPLFYMVAGVIVSSVVAAMPGVGSLLALSVILPYSFTLQPYEAIALLLGIGAVSNTANTFPSVLLAVPGSVGSQATIVDGYPMAQNGEAKRAFGAAFSASAIGGIFGAAVLFASLPVLRPIVLSIGSPEFFMLVVWGLTAVGVLSGSAPAKGLLAALLGLLISTIGIDNKTGLERYVFDTIYLEDGINIVILGLAIFAVPELIDLAVRRTSIAGTEKLGSGLRQGIRDTIDNWWLVLRCSIIGVWIGVLPGLGSTVADWFAYAHAVQTEKNPENFGKGDVRGVIAPEASNNAKEGGALIPTIAFGIPGSTSLALILIAFISVGIEPGPKMLSTSVHYVYAMVWVLVIANLLAAGLALGFSSTFARATLLPYYIVIPATLLLCIVAAFTVSYSWGDILAFLGLSVLGMVMKHLNWPRPPLLIAVVLGQQMETYLWLSSERYGFESFTRPGTLILLVLILLTLFLPIIRRWRERRAAGGTESRGGAAVGLSDLIFLAIIIGLFVFALDIALDWAYKSSLIIFGIAGLGGFLGILLVAGFALDRLRAGARTEPKSSSSESVERGNLTETLIWIVGLFVCLFVFGFHITYFVFPLIYARGNGARWRTALILAIAIEFFLISVFDYAVNVIWPLSLIGGFVADFPG
ncbi:MAG: tripartite tricarboxylate transporter permease [Proteobacteria bacterium]|nr:tripartite tricarboxylate transporter permease [Pseudomonadota bacterium]